MAASTGESPSNLPTSIDEVERLVHELYRPGAQIFQIQETLQRLQRSAEGWQLGSALLGSSDEKVQFFGALTFTVKLNSDSESLSEADANALLDHLINALIGCLDQNERASTLVIRKLCSTLVVFFLQFSSLWTKCVLHLVYCLSVGRAVPADSARTAPELSELVQALHVEKASVALWFCTSLAEEVGKTDANNIKHHKYHERLQLNVDGVVALVKRGLVNISDSTQTRFQQDCMKCFQAWVLYSHRAFIDAYIVYDPLKTLTKTAIACLVQPELYEVTVELFSDVLSNYSQFLDGEDIQLLFSVFRSPWSSKMYDDLIKGDFSFESLLYGHFMIALGDATVQNLAQKTDAESQQFLTALVGLLAAEGWAAAEDQIFVPALEFWSTFVEVMIDSLYSDGPVESFGGAIPVQSAQTDEMSPNIGSAEVSTRPWFSTARSFIMLAIERCWRKIQFPQPEYFETWDSVDKTGFADARKDVADLLQSSYTLTGVTLFSMFARMTIQSLETGAWQELEASLFCLGALADCISEEEATDSVLGSVFGSSLFNILVDSDAHVPARTRQTALLLIGQYNNYFERHVEFLPNALDFLFKALTTPAISGTASRSIISLCSSCRQSLSRALPMFFQQYVGYVSHGNPDSLVKERVVGAIAAVVQALPGEMEKKGPITQLVQFVEGDLEQCHTLVLDGDIEGAQAHGLEALRCLASIAKGLQAPSDVPVDLDITASPGLSDQFWISGDGAFIQKHIKEIIERVMLVLPRSGEIVEAACSVFRAGFTEKLPGPFVFLPHSVVDFIVRATPLTPRLGAVIITACSLVSSQTVEPSEAIDDSLHKLLAWLLLILQSLEGPANDPEIAQTGIDFIHRLLPKYLSVLIHLPPSSLEYTLIFTLKSLAGQDPLPKSAAAEFWSQFVSLSNLSPLLQTSVDNVLEHFGPLLAEALVHNISGNASRSELDKVSDPLKKLVVRQVRAKSWLESALYGKALPNDALKESDKRAFLQRIISLRGARQTNQVVKDFWLACRGSSFAYAS